MKRVLILGDSPILNTGFGTVNRHAAQAFQKEGFEVASVAALTTERGNDVENGIRMFYPAEGDVMGVGRIHEACTLFQPDLLYMTADAGTATALAQFSPNMASLMYIPIEGQPLGNTDWRNLIGKLPVVTCSQYGVDIIKRDTGKDATYVYHGIDHETFRVTGERQKLRSALGWSDKFVVMAVSTNVRRKQLPRLIQAISILKHKYHVKDLVLYLHTVPFQGYWLDGHNLAEVVQFYDVDDMVIFNEHMKKRNDSVPENDYLDSDGKWRPGLVSLYNAADLFVNPSQVEGFGLPTAEAMACGLPVLVTKYAAGWEIAQPAGRGIPVQDWEMHKSTTLYANIDPEALAKEILRLKNSPKERERMSKAGLERVKDFSWDEFGQVIVAQAKAVIDANQGSDSAGQEAHKVEETGEQAVDIPANQTKGIAAS